MNDCLICNFAFSGGGGEVAARARSAHSTLNPYISETAKDSSNSVRCKKDRKGPQKIGESNKTSLELIG